MRADMIKTIRIALPVALLLAATSARAQSEAAAAAGYRWQVAATDVAAIGAAAAGFALEGRDGALGYVPSNTLMGVGIGGYFLGAPIVHLTHDEYARAGLSLLARVALPVVGAAIGARFATCAPNGYQALCGLEEMGRGMQVGAVVAAVVDSAFITAGSTSETAPERIAAAPRPRAGVGITPRLAATPNAAMLGIGGQF